MNKLASVLLLLAAACVPPAESTEDRGALGKADLIGSCRALQGDLILDNCGGQSTEGNCYCDEYCETFGDCCADKASVCDGASGFESVKLQRTGFCAPTHDCNAWVALDATGRIAIDPPGSPGAPVKEATVTAEELANVAALVSSQSFRDFLADEDACGEPPTDVYYGLTVKLDGQEYRQNVTFCRAPAWAPVKAALEALQTRYGQE